MVDGQGTAIKGGARFELRRKLGEGGAGVVFEAFDRERNEVIAIKTLRGRSIEALVQLKNEFRAVQGIHHPNLVRLGELFEEAGEWFFTMELVPGVDLLAWVRAPTDGSGAVPRFDEARLRTSLAQVARGLSALHDAGKIHRDVKPSNVLVTPDGRAVLLDFGIAADALRLERPSEELQGTIAYIAPEQVAGGPVTKAADWYAVGVVLYEALTGQAPILGGDVLGRKLSVVPAPPRSLAPGIPPDLEQLCVDLLQIDPRARPEGRDVLARLNAPLEEVPPAPRSSVRVFVGRQKELRALEEAFAETQRGRSVTVAVRGESGVGKSFLVQQFTSEVTRMRADAAILAGRCYERESVPYKAIDGIIDELRHYLWEVPRTDIGKLLPRGMSLLAQLFPVLDTFVPKGDTPPDGPVANPQEQRLRAFAVLRSLLSKLAKRAPVVLVIDDLQWADADSLVLLGEIMRPPQAPRLLLVVTTRGEAPPSLSGEVRHVPLVELPAEDAEELVNRLLAVSGAPRGGLDARSIALEAKGHPLFIDELVRQRTGHEASVVRLDEALWKRAEHLPPDARQVLELAAVAGSPVSIDAAIRATGLETGRLHRAMATLASGRFVRMTGVVRAEAVEAYHDRVRESVLAHLTPAARIDWHARIADALEHSPAFDPEAIAFHYGAAGDHERATTHALAAARRSEGALAFDRASQLYRAALAWEGLDAAGRRAAEASLAEALTNAGRGAEAAEVRLKLARDAPPLEALDLRRIAAELLLCSGHFDAGVAHLRGVLREVGIASPESPFLLLLYLLVYRLVLLARGVRIDGRAAGLVSAAELVRIDAVRSAAAGFAMSDNIRGAYFQTRNLLLALDAGDPVRVLRALSMEICFTATGGRRTEERTAELLDEAERLAALGPTPEARALVAAAKGYARYFVGDWKVARSRLSESEALFRDECLGAAFELNSVRFMLYLTLAYRGELRELERRVAPVLREVETRSDLYSVVNLATTARTLLGLARGTPAQVRSELRTARGALPPQRFFIQHFFAFLSEVQLELYEGRGVVALERVRAAWPALRRSLLLRVSTIFIAAVAARAQSALAAAAESPAGRAARLRRARRDARLLDEQDHPWATAEALLVRAGAAAIVGDDSNAIELFERAARAFERAGMKLQLAVAELRRSELLRARDEQGAELLVVEATRALEEEGVRSPWEFSAVFSSSRSRASTPQP